MNSMRKVFLISFVGFSYARSTTENKNKTTLCLSSSNKYNT